MELLPTPHGVASLLSNPSPLPPSDLLLQVLDLKPVGNSSSRYTLLVNDGSMKLKAMLPTSMAPDVQSGKLQSLGLIRVLDYTCNTVPGQPQKVLIITKAEVVAPALDHEVGVTNDNAKGVPMTDANAFSTNRDFQDVKPSIKLEPKGKSAAETVLKSAAQIVQEQHGNAAPAARMGISRRVYPLVSLNPYQGNWTIKARVTSKGPLRTYRNGRGEGNVFNVELTDEDGTQIQATMFKEAADKFYPKLELGKVYYISKGSLRVANKQYSTVKNDYEMTLNANAEVEEAVDEVIKIPELSHEFVKIDELGPYVNGRKLVDIIGIVQNVSAVLTIRRKSNNEEIPKRDITIFDESQKTVVVALWNDLAVKEGSTLLDMVNGSPIVSLKGLRVSDFQGVSLSTTTNSVVMIDPDFPEAHKLRSWFASEGKGAHFTSAGASLPGATMRAGSRSLYSEREVLSEITKPSVGEDKPAYFNARAYLSFIKPDQTMWYLACQTCNRKVTEERTSKFWCEGCQKHFEECNRRYILQAKISDASGECWISAFNQQAEQLLGHSADELAGIRSQDADQREYQAKLKKAVWAPYVFHLSVAQTEYMNEKRQRITVRSLAPVDWAGECKFLLEEMAKLRGAASGRLS